MALLHSKDILIWKHTHTLYTCTTLYTCRQFLCIYIFQRETLYVWHYTRLKPKKSMAFSSRSFTRSQPTNRSHRSVYWVSTPSSVFFPIFSSTLRRPIHFSLLKVSHFLHLCFIFLAYPFYNPFIHPLYHYWLRRISKETRFARETSTHIQ